MLFRITAMAVVTEWVSVQVVLTMATAVMETVFTVTIHMGTILTVHTTPMVVDMVTTLMVMEWVD
jgi:hypothetical protein